MIPISFLSWVVLLVNLPSAAPQIAESCETDADGVCTTGADNSGLNARVHHKFPYYAQNVPGGTSEVISTTHGTFLSSLLDRGISHYLKTYGEYEHPKMRPVLDLIEESDSPIYLDIGAHIGVWTVALARHRGGAARVYSIEAVLETYYYLGANIVLNGLHNVVTYHGVVADRPGLVDVIGYNLTGDLYLNSAAISIAHSAHLKQASNGQARTRPTPSFTLDSLYESGKIPACPTFIKLDIETYELLALRGATRMLSECQPTLMMEFACQELNKSLMALLDRLGYSLAWLIAPYVENPEVLREHTIQDIYRDVTVVAVPKVKRYLWQQEPTVEVFVPIVPGLTTFEQYKIQVCDSQGMCTSLKQHNESSAWLCASIPRDHRDFYKTLINPATGEFYT